MLPALSNRASSTVLSIWLLACVAAFVIGSRHWALVNDPAQLDYVCFLMDHGMAPYKTIVETNMPGIYLTNWCIMHWLGSGPAAWRIFDLSLLFFAGASMLWVAKRESWLAGVFAACLFALLHGRDGAAQQGQRDFIIAVMLLMSYAFLFECIRHGRRWPMFLVGLFASAAGTIKPPAFAMAAFLVIAAVIEMRRKGKSSIVALSLALAGIATPLIIVFFFLHHFGAIEAFVHASREMLPYYAVLGRVKFPVLLGTFFTSSMATFLALGLLAASLRKAERSWEYWMIVAGMIFGAFSFFAQGKGFPYHRYPFLAFLLLWVGMEFTASTHSYKLSRIVGYGGLAFGAVVAPLYAQRAVSRHWDETFNTALTQDLQALGGTKLSGSVQCMTTAADCDTNLLRMGLVQSTGLVYDYFVFAPNHVDLVTETQNRIWPEIVSSPPRVIVVGRTLYPERSDSYRKLAYWPVFRNYLETHYVLYDERLFAPAECGIRGFRIYVLKGAMPGSGLSQAVQPQQKPY